MQAIMADNNMQGHLQALLRILEGDAWRDVWIALQLEVRSFADLDLDPDVSDSVLWHTCQQEEVILLTDNRNAAGPDSLEVTIRTHNAAHHLPVFTIADTQQVLQSRAYAERVAERLLEYLLEIDNYRGTGRLYLP